MSHQAVNWAIQQRAGGPAQKATLWSIANYANEHWCAWPSQKTICNESEQSPDAVQRWIKILEADGLIRRVPLRFAGRRSIDFFLLPPSPYFTSSIEEIEPIMPRGYSPFVPSEPARCTQSGLDNAAADGGSVRNAAANAAALERQQDESLEPVNHGKMVESAPARVPLVSSEAITLAEEIAAIAGFPDPRSWPPGWCGAAMRVDAFLRDGYHPEVLRIAAREVMAGHGSKPPPWSIAFFERAFARVRGRQQAPLPSIEMSQARSYGSCQVQPNKSVSAYAGALARRLGSEANSVDVLSLPPRRLQRPAGICDDLGNESSEVSDGRRGVRDRSGDGNPNPQQVSAKRVGGD
jgi:hypothetical protein